MEREDVEVLRHARDWHARGGRALLATVLSTYGASPRLPGSMLLVRDDGALFGSVSGGCVDDDVRRRYLANEIARVVRVRYGDGLGDRERFRLPCGGVIELLLEPSPPADGVSDLLARLQRGTACVREVDVESGGWQLWDSAPVAEAGGARRVHIEHGPARRLLLIGAGATSAQVARMAPALDYDIVVCEPREEYARAWDARDGDVIAAMPDDAVRELTCARTAVLALSHDPKLDDLALLEALPSPAYYVGAIGSRANQAKRRKRLRSLGVPEAALARLRGPIGLAIGSRTPAEIALAILAELVTLRRPREAAVRIRKTCP